MEVIMYDLNVLIFDINKTAEDEEQVKTLNNLLSLFGGKAEIKNTFDRNQLVLSYDEEKLKKWKTRNAGRTSNYYNLSVKEVREMINTLGAEQAAAKLGMTKQGMYKRLKRCLEIKTRRPKSSRKSLTLRGHLKSNFLF
jgi:hypothetical protein